MRMHACTQPERMHAKRRLAAHITHSRPTIFVCCCSFFFSVWENRNTPCPPLSWVPVNYCWSGPSPPIPSFPPPPLPPSLPLSHSHLCSDSADKPLNKITPRPSPFRPPGTILPLLADGPVRVGWIRYPWVVHLRRSICTAPFCEPRIPHIHTYTKRLLPGKMWLWRRNV